MKHINLDIDDIIIDMEVKAIREQTMQEEREYQEFISKLDNFAKEWQTINTETD